MKSDWRLIEDAVEMAGLSEEFEKIIESLRAVARAAKKLNIKLEGVEPERDIDYTASWGAFRDLYEALDALPAWALKEDS